MPFQQALENWGKIRPNTFAGYSQAPNINLINSAEKKKPHNIQINNNRKEPKVKANLKYSAAHNFRRYKSKIEPSLHSKIMINEEDDIIGKIREAFGLGGKKTNTNYADVETAPADSMIMNVEEPPADSTAFGSGTRPEQQELKVSSIYDIDPQDQEEITGMAVSPTSPARPRSSAIVAFPEQARPSMSEDDFFERAKIILTETQWRALYDLKPMDKAKLSQFNARDARYFTVDDVKNNSAAELRGVLNMKRDAIDVLQAQVRAHKEAIPYRELVKARDSASHELSFALARTRAQTALKKQIEPIRASESFRQNRAAKRITEYMRKSYFGGSLSASELSALSTAAGASSSSPTGVAAAPKPVGRPATRPSTLARKAGDAKKLDEAVKASKKK